MRARDTLLLRIAAPADGTALHGAGRIVEMRARALREGGCVRAAWSDEARRERILNPPKEEVREQTLTPRHRRSHGGGIGM